MPQGKIQAFARAVQRLPPPPPLATFLLLMSLHGAYTLFVGVAHGGDTSSYDHWARRLVETGFDYHAVWSEASSRFPAALYALFVTLVALLQIPFGDGWTGALAAVNVAAGAALGTMIVRLAVRTTRSGFAGWAALGLYAGCFDLFHWIPFALSDVTFTFLAFTVFSLAAARILGDAQGWKRISGLAVVGVFYRPTGMVLLPDLGWAAYLAGKRSSPIAPAVAAAAFAVAIAGGTLLFAWLMQDPSRWPFEALSTVFRHVAADYALGEVVNARLETYHRPPRELFDFALISADRFLHFFALGAANFSAGHWVLQFLFFVPCYGLASWLLVQLARRRTRFGEGERRVFLAAAGAVLAYALFHGLVQVDYDWRYRLPILPHLILLASGGFADLSRRMMPA